jgi:hypothetical protein
MGCNDINILGVYSQHFMDRAQSEPFGFDCPLFANELAGREALDRHPDLALGKCGIYFPKKLKYYEMAWSGISKVEVVRRRHEKKRKEYPPVINFYGFGRTERTLRDVGPLTDPVLCTIPSLFGFEQEAIIAAINEFAPTVAVCEAKIEIG